MSNHSAQGNGGALSERNLGWSKVAALGIAIAVSGSFAGWNYGLAMGGWGGMFAATIAMALLFFGLTQCLAELATMLPNAAGFDSYVEFAFNRTAGFMAGMSVAMGLAVGVGLAVSFAAGYCQGLFGLGGWPIKGALLAVIFALQLRGASETAGWTMLVGGTALAVLILFCMSVGPYFNPTYLFASEGNNPHVLFYGGLAGIYHCIPFALFFFIGVEQATQAAAEMRDVSTTMPRALMTAIGVVTFFAVAVLVLSTASAGITRLSTADDPLLSAVLAHPASPTTRVLARIVGVGALFALIATLFSLIYAASRQFYYLGQSRYLPEALASINRRGVPSVALGLVGSICLIAAAFRPEHVMVVFIFLLSVSHLLAIASFLRLRATQPSILRPYRAIGGTILATIAAGLSLLVMMTCVQLELLALTCTLIGLSAMFLYFRYKQKRLSMMSLKS